ncbi:MAG TPA: B12-binding domain-containing protein [Ktedonobacteraceae bacterium]|nr:B12-binding domain-containing protein [Ktedonobacteraceae bacterium]
MMARGEHIDAPDLERYPDIPLFNTKAVVQQTGVLATTLRAWERRYRILSPDRSNNAYRLYSERDIAKIRWLKARVDSGMTISQAIALLHHMDAQRRQRRETWNQIPGSADFSVFQIALPVAGEVSPADTTAGSAASETATTTAEQPGTSHQDEKRMGFSSPTYSMWDAQQRLLEAFQVFDEVAARAVMASMLAIYPTEEICIELIRPVMWRIGKLWEEGLITVSVEHFASAFFRGLLANLLHSSPASPAGPLVITCCAPGEAHELAPLMLALLLRRSGLRVVYLGQSIEIAGLLHTIRQTSPALLCISLSIFSFKQGLIDLSHLIWEMSPPRPILICGGQAFEKRPDLIPQVQGLYLNGDLRSNVAYLHQLAFEPPSGSVAIQ